MKTNEILESNTLIANFMTNGENMYNQVDYITDLWFPAESCEELAFDKSWDWLMPVVEKIESLGFTCDMSTGCTGFGRSGEPVLDVGGSRKEATYKAVVEFIKWYNENK